jgi:hypothetical protein
MSAEKKQSPILWHWDAPAREEQRYKRWNPLLAFHHLLTEGLWRFDWKNFGNYGG